MNKKKIHVIACTLIVFLFYINLQFSSFNNGVKADAMGVELKWSFQTGLDIQSSAVAADLDRDGTLEILIGSNDMYFYCLSHTGLEEWSYLTW